MDLRHLYNKLQPVSSYFPCFNLIGLMLRNSMPLKRNLYEMDAVRKAAQQAATREYGSFHSLINRKDTE